MHESCGFEYRNPISPYVCSTPLDFTEEREHLSTNVFPQLNDLCKSRGSYFSPVDLRWEPGDQKTEGGLLLKTQLDCIKKCSPFFICLLGETYGPYRNENEPPLVNPRNGRGIKIPEGCDWLDKNLLLAGSGGHPWVFQEGHQTSSIPELEVTQGAFLCDNQHATLYYRQAEHLELKLQDLEGPENEDARNDVIARYSSESEHARIKILDLRQRVVNKGVPVKYFTSVEELGQLVLEDWLEIIDIILPPLMHDAQFLDTLNYSEWLAQESFNIRRSRVFVSAPDIDETLHQLSDFAATCTRGEVKADGEDFFLTDTSGSQVRSYSATAWFRKRPVSNTISTSIMLLTGDRGVGKSALAARWLNEFRSENPHIAVVSHFVSASHNSADIVSFLHQSVSKLRRKYLLSDSYKSQSICAKIEREYDETDQSFSSLCEAFLAAVGLGPCVILLDGLNELGAAHGLSIQEVKEFSWLPENLPSTCKIIFTTTHSDISHRCLSQRQDVCVIKCPEGLTDATCTVEMVKEHITGIKQLVGGENVVKKLANLKIMQTALGSRVVGSEITCFRVYCDMAKFMENCAEIWSLRNFWVMCVQNWVQEHSWALDEPSSEINFVDSGFDYSGWVVDSLCLIAVSRNGLTQHQILSILKMIGYTDDLRVTSYDWLQFRLAAGATLSENADGRIVFGHRYLQEIAEYLFFKTMSSFSFDPAIILKFSSHDIRQIYHVHLAQFFSQQTLNTQVMEELPWQLMLSGDTSGLLDYLTDCGALLKMLSGEGDQWHQDLKLYWSVCELSGHHPGTVYLQLTHSLAVVDVNEVQVLEDNYDNSHSEMFSPTPRVIISTPQPESQCEIQEDEFYHRTSPQTEEIYDPVKRKLSEDLGTTDFVIGVFVTQGGQRSILQVGQAKGINKDNFPGVASLSWYIGCFLQKLGETEACRILFTSLIKYMKRNYPLTFEQQILLCQCHHRVGKISEASEDLVTAEREYRAALHTLVAADDMDEDLEHQEDTQYLRGLLLSCHGRIRTQGNDLFDSEELLKEALECVEDNLNCFVLKSEIYYSLGLLRSSQGDFPRAESCLRESIKLRSQWFGRCHSLVADALVALGKLLALPNNVKGRDVIQAENLFRQALSIEEKCLGTSNLTVARVLFDLGELLSEEQSHQAKMEAQKFLRRSLDIRTTELGGNHPLTLHTQQSLTRLDIALKMGQYEFGSARSSGRRSNSTPFSALTLRESDLVRLQNRMNSTMRVEDPLSVRAVSKDEVIRHNRPDSIMSSVMSFTSASERLLSAPIAERPRLLRREKETHSRQTVHPQRYGSISEDVAGKNVVIVDSLDSKGRRQVVGADNYPESEFSDMTRKELENQRDDGVDEPPDDALNLEVNGEGTEPVDFQDRMESKSGDHEDYIYDSENQMFDSDGQDGRYANEKKSVTLRPSSAPRRMFERFGNSNGIAKRAKSSSKLGSANSAHRNWSGRSNITTASSVASGHHSRCPPPGPHDITVSNTRSVSGPHSSLTSLLGESPCPSPSSNEIHHRSAWYHIPGRYATPQEWYPRKRMQKTENAKDINAFMTLKSNWAKKRQKELQQAKFREQKEQEAALLKTRPAKNILTNSKASVTSTNSLGRLPAYNRFGCRQKITGKKEATPRLMISGLDMVPETRYSAGYNSSQGQVVKFKEPIVVG